MMASRAKGRRENGTTWSQSDIIPGRHGNGGVKEDLVARMAVAEPALQYKTETGRACVRYSSCPISSGVPMVQHSRKVPAR